MVIKKTVIAMMLFTVVLVACAAGGKTDTTAAAIAQESTESSGGDTDVSYAVGVFLGMDLKGSGFIYNFNYEELAQGFKDAFEGNDLRLTQEEAGMKIQIAFNEFREKLAAENMVKETVFLTDNGKRNGVITTASGLQYEVIKQGAGTKPTASSTVRVNYEGTLIDGTVFDSSYTRGEPAEFPLAGVIPGWTEGIQLMSVGSTYNLYIPSELAYGEQGGGDVIGPNSALIFKVELLEIVN
jgi:FKBP-type peptidyl-prolyl cis-trans isomerase